MRATSRMQLLSRLLAGVAALALASPASSLADEQAHHDASPAAKPPPRLRAQPKAPPTPPAPATTAVPAPAPASPGSPKPARRRRSRASARRAATPGHARAARDRRARSGERRRSEAGAGSAAGARARHHAPSPSTLTPSLPFGLESSIAGIPGFFIENFRIPPFLLPIYQAAGTAYGIPWQVLAAINEVETDYGRDLSVSSAGAEGWMQFLPAEWAQYGVDANGDGFKDPYNPADAIFAAARYLRAAGG